MHRELTAAETERFWSLVAKSDGCWEWTGQRVPRGYGRFRIRLGPNDWQIISAHRIAWRLEHGPIPEGLEILHRCDNRGCVRHDHLFTGTQVDNILDCVAKERHIRGERVPTAKLTPNDVRAIRASSGSARQVGKRFGVGRTAVQNIRSGTSWKHVT